MDISVVDLNRVEVYEVGAELWPEVGDGMTG